MRLALLGVLLLLVGGCADYEHSEEMTEPATVTEVAYVPSQHGTGVGPSFGSDSSGNSTMGIAITSVSISEKYAVVFECQHGKFIVESEKDGDGYKLWQRLKEGQQVTVSYREMYWTKKRNGEIVEKHLVGYDFLNAY